MLRECRGLILVFLYLFAAAAAAGPTIMRSFFVKMGFVRFLMLVTCCSSWPRCRSRWCCAGPST